MSGKVLVAYATKYGSTEEVARAIGKTFAAEGTAADVMPVYDVAEFTEYQAVVFGSPLYAGKLRAELVGFVKRNIETLSAMPRALFVTGLTMVQPTRKSVQKVIKQTKPFVELLKPADVGLFAGSVRYADVGFFTRLLLRMMKVPEGDHRKWDVIERWAKDLLPRLTER